MPRHRKKSRNEGGVPSAYYDVDTTYSSDWSSDDGYRSHGTNRGSGHNHHTNSARGRGRGGGRGGTNHSNNSTAHTIPHQVKSEANNADVIAMPSSYVPPHRRSEVNTNTSNSAAPSTIRGRGFAAGSQTSNFGGTAASPSTQVAAMQQQQQQQQMRGQYQQPQAKAVGQQSGGSGFVTTIAEALAVIEGLELSPHDIVSMPADEYNSLTASLNFTTPIAIVLKTKMRNSLGLSGGSSLAGSVSSSSMEQQQFYLQQQQQQQQGGGVYSTSQYNNGGMAMMAHHRHHAHAPPQHHQHQHQQQHMTMNTNSSSTRGLSTHSSAVVRLKEERIAELEAQLRDTKEDAFKRVDLFRKMTRATGDDIVKAVRDVALQGTMQVAFVIDGTGSMDPHIQEVKDRIVRIADSLQSATGTSTTFGLVVYRDYDDDDHRLEVYDFANAHQLVKRLGDVVATGGYDQCEDCFGGLDAAMKLLGWSTAARLIIWIGDAPNHGPKYSGSCYDSYADEPLPIDGLELGALAKKTNVNTVFLSLTSDTDAMIGTLQEEYEAFSADLRACDGADLATTILGELSKSALATHTMALLEDHPDGSVNDSGDAGAIVNAGTATVTSARKKRESAAVKEVPIRHCTPAKADFGSQMQCQVLTPQSFPTIPGIHPFELLLSEFPKCHTEVRSAQLSKFPFAKGELRYAFHCRLSESKMNFFAKWKNHPTVAKTPIRLNAPQLGFHQVHMQTVARFLANEFNERIKDFRLPHKRPITYLPVQLLKAGPAVYLVEPFIEGKYLKFNNNNGAVTMALVHAHPIPQAFSHFTYNFSAGKLLVCDVQGVVQPTDGYVLTDPAIHTTNRRALLPDLTNMGLSGIAAFFKTHVCNEYCAQLGLPKHKPMENVGVVGGGGGERGGSGSVVSNNRRSGSGGGANSSMATVTADSVAMGTVMGRHNLDEM